jgi:hypothetical protein
VTAGRLASVASVDGYCGRPECGAWCTIQQGGYGASCTIRPSKSGAQCTMWRTDLVHLAPCAERPAGGCLNARGTPPRRCPTWGLVGWKLGPSAWWLDFGLVGCLTKPTPPLRGRMVVPVPTHLTSWRDEPSMRLGIVWVPASLGRIPFTGSEGGARWW